MSKRLDLRAFQQNLSDRMQDRGRMGGQMSWLGVKIAGQNWLVEMADISEVLSLPRLAMCRWRSHGFAAWPMCGAIYTAW